MIGIIQLGKNWKDEYFHPNTDNQPTTVDDDMYLY